jgi:peptidoglycan biosynthesis protein MviN/MurJ (putative lipid II flippase)
MHLVGFTIEVILQCMALLMSQEVPRLGCKGRRSTKYFTVKKCVYLMLPATKSMGRFNVNTLTT